MDKSKKFKIVVLILLAVVVVYLIYQNNTEPFESTPSDMDRSNMSDLVDLAEYSKSLNDGRSGDSSTSYKPSRYNANNRSTDSNSIDQFFDSNRPEDYQGSYSPSTSGDELYASFVPDKTKEKLSDKDKFDASALMPVESGMDWFDDPYEETTVKNSSLINIYRPVGVNTVQTSLKNPSHDLRGTEPNPKYPVSPWMQSSYEPDTNLRSGAFC
jgi:hypothetical protein